MRCDQLDGRRLSDAADGAAPLDADRARAHVEQCLRCQAELVQYRKLLRGAAGDADRGARAGARRCCPRSSPASRRPASAARCAACSSGRRVAYVGGIAAATAAGAAGAIVLATRSPPHAARGLNARSPPARPALRVAVCSMFGPEGRLLSCPLGPDPAKDTDFP